MARTDLLGVLKRRVEGILTRQRAGYRQTLQGLSRALTGPVAQPRLLLLIADQIEAIFHPKGLAIFLSEDAEVYRGFLARGRLASNPAWQRGSQFAQDHFLVKELASHHRPVDVPWFLNDAALTQKQGAEQVEAAGVRLLIPMHHRNRLLGWLALGARLSDRPYNRADRDFLSAVADQAAVALENARLSGEMQQRATELAMLAMVSSALSSSLDLEQVLRTIVESVTKVVNCDKSAIFELSEDGKYLSLHMSKGMSERYLEASRQIPVASHNRAMAIVTGEPLIVTDIWHDPRLADISPLARQEGYRGVVDLPLFAREGPLGVLSVYFDGVHTPSAMELEVLTTFANQAAIAIENARLYAAAMRERDRARALYEQTDAALDQRVEELTAIEAISRRLTSTLDLQQVLNVVLEQMLQATQTDRGVISLYDADRRCLFLVAQAGFPEELSRYKVEPWSEDWGITGRVARTGIPALVADVAQDPDYVEGATTTRSQITVPIIWEERSIGVLTLESDQENAFTQEHLRFAELLAAHAAIGIHNAQLFQQAMEGRDRLQAILNSTHDAVIVFDTAGQVILLNAAVQEWFGPTVTRWFRTRSLLETMADSESILYRLTNLDPKRMAGLRTDPALEANHGMELAFTFRRGKRQRYLEATVAPVLSAAGETFGWVTVMRDMTRQQDLEHFREDLTSMVIHNLQGPLAAIVSSLETLHEMDGIEPDLAERLLAIALESGRKLHSRIDSVLWLRRLEDRQMPLNCFPTPLAAIVDGVMNEYRAMARLGGVSMQSFVPDDLPLVLIDEEVIGRVFSNLLDNALKYTPSLGRVEVRAVVEPAMDSRVVVCSVSDTGPGISAHMREAVFEKFYRGGEWRAKRKGMGIGLHYCKLAIESHGGRIWVDCQPASGSVFSFTLPTENTQSR